jgi:hypothetical protein
MEERGSNFAQMAPTSGVAEDTAISANPLVRTLWHSVYEQTESSAEFSFFLGDEKTEDGNLAARHSPYLKFTLARAA